MQRTILADPWRREDASFIAHAREDIPFLLGEVERLRADDEKAMGAVQDLWVENEQLETEVERLRAENTALESKLVMWIDRVRRAEASEAALRKERDDLKARLRYVRQYANEVSNERVFDED